MLKSELIPEKLREISSLHADRTALVVGTESRTYGELLRESEVIATMLAARADEAPFIAYVGERSVAAYEQLFGIVLAGSAYLALEPQQPAQRLAELINRAAVTCILTGSRSLGLVQEICRQLDRAVTVVVTDASRLELAEAAFEPRHTLLDRDMMASTGAKVSGVSADDPIYLMFTSGSTGTPKAVMATQRCLSAKLAATFEPMDIGPGDVVAQLAKLSFVVSSLNTFMAWCHGATLVVPAAEDGILTETALIDRFGITLWNSVPSRTRLMARARQMKPGAFPSLRYVIQVGELLTSDLAEAWAVAAPNADVFHVYGCSEGAAARYKWRGEASLAECDDGRVPMGIPVAGITYAIVDEDLRECAPGEPGEFVVQGDQVADAYFQDPDRTARSFVPIPGRSGRYYRTGDVVGQPQAGGPLHYVGRVDHQIKVQGRRVELGAIEATARHALGVEEVAAIGWPPVGQGFDGVELFVVGGSADVAADRQTLSGLLAPEELPRHIRYVDELPLTPNGKCDRFALANSLEANL